MTPAHKFAVRILRRKTKNNYSMNFQFWWDLHSRIDNTSQFWRESTPLKSLLKACEQRIENSMGACLTSKSTAHVLEHPAPVSDYSIPIWCFFASNTTNCWSCNPPLSATLANQVNTVVYQQVTVLEPNSLPTIYVQSTGKIKSDFEHGYTQVRFLPWLTQILISVNHSKSTAPFLRSSSYMCQSWLRIAVQVKTIS